MTKTDLERRLSRALTSLANEVPDDHAYPGVESLRRTQRSPIRRPGTWVAVAITAAAAVTLAVAVPYQLFGDQRSVDPAEKIPSPPPFVVKGEVVGEPGSERVEVTVRERKSGRLTSKVEVQNGYSITVARDMSTYYIESHDKNRDCVSTISTFTVNDKGEASEPELVEGSESSKGIVYSDLTLSPDGSRLAFTATRFPDNLCDWPMSGEDRSYVGVLDLRSGEHKLWALEPPKNYIISRPKTWPDQSNLTWQLDGSRVIIPWSSTDPNAYIGILDPDKPAGKIEDAAKAIRLDPKFLDRFPKHGGRPMITMEPLRADGSYSPGTMAYLAGAGRDDEFYAVYHRLRLPDAAPTAIRPSFDPARPPSSRNATDPARHAPHHNYLVRINAKTGEMTAVSDYPPSR